jgi:hypothetical protein
MSVRTGMSICHDRMRRTIFSGSYSAPIIALPTEGNVQIILISALTGIKRTSIKYVEWFINGDCLNLWIEWGPEDKLRFGSLEW